MTGIPDNVTRAEWTAVVAVLLNLGTIVFTGGVLYQQVQDNSRRIVQLESETSLLVRKLERIDANVIYLAERAREDREARKQ